MWPKSMTDAFTPAMWSWLLTMSHQAVKRLHRVSMVWPLPCLLCMALTAKYSLPKNEPTLPIFALRQMQDISFHYAEWSKFFFSSLKNCPFVWVIGYGDQHDHTYLLDISFLCWPFFKYIRETWRFKFCLFSPLLCLLLKWLPPHVVFFSYWLLPGQELSFPLVYWQPWSDVIDAPSVLANTTLP